MANTILQRLRDARDGILLGEVGASLHMIGKLSNEFLAHESLDRSNTFCYQAVCDDNSFLGGRLCDLMTDAWVQPRFVLPGLPSGVQAPVSLDTFIRQHRNRDVAEPVLRFLVDAHGIVSGVEKNLPELLPDHLQQRWTCLWRATPFGLEEENLASVDLDVLRNEITDHLADLLSAMRDGKPADWEGILLGHDGLRLTLEPVMSRALGDTRRPVNEVTLWDQSYVTAALLKSSLARVVLENAYQDPLRDRKPTWRILGVALDRWQFVRKAVRLGDAEGYQRAVDCAFDKLKALVEVEVPLGSEIYRDTRGIFFTFPDVEDGLRDEIIGALGPEILRLVHDVEPEFAPHIVTSKPSRSVTVLATAIQDVREVSEHPYRTSMVSRALQHAWHPATRSLEVCTACQLRPMPEGDETCEHCRKRRVGRAKEWLENPKRTVWLDEVADEHDRCALLVGRFDLTSWLDGTSTASLRSLTVGEFLLEWNKKHAQDQIADYQTLVARITDDLRCNSTDSQLLKALHSGYWPTRQQGARAFYEVIVKERDVTGTAASVIADDWTTKARLFVLFLFRKHPSPARLRRFWETTARFFDTTVVRLLDDRLIVRPGRERTSFEITWAGTSPVLPSGATLDIRVNDVSLSPVWDGSRFRSTWNPALFPSESWPGPGGSVTILEGKEATARESGTRLQGTIQNAIAHGAAYASWIPLLLSADQFVGVVPSDEALGLARDIFLRYQVQFSKVRDRLPLHMGVLTFHRRLPLYAALDSANRVLDMSVGASSEVAASVEDIGEVDAQMVCEHLSGGLGSRVTRLGLKVEQGAFAGQTVEWLVSRSTGDPDFEDCWTANLRMDTGGSGRIGAFQDVDGGWFIPVRSLQQGDRVRLRPSVVTLQHLDRAAARFEAGRTWSIAEGLDRMSAIWAVLDNGIRTRRWSIRQVRALRDTVEERRQRWGEMPQDFVDACLFRHLGLDSSCREGQVLRTALADGMFALSLFWNLTIAHALERAADTERRDARAKTL